MRAKSKRAAAEVCVLWTESTRNVRSVLTPKLRQERHVYSRQTPRAISFVFQRRGGGGDCAGDVHKLNGRAGERHRRAAEKQKES